MSVTLRARHVLSAGLAIALVLGLLVRFDPPARAQSCYDSISNSGIAWTGRSVVLVASGQGIDGGDLYYFWQTTGTSTWHKELVAAAGCVGNGWQPLAPLGYRANAIAWTGDSVVIAAMDMRNGGVYYWWQGNGSTAWHQQTVAAGQPGCCSWTGVAAVLTSTDACGDLDYWWQRVGTVTWNKQRVDTNTSWPPGTC